MAASWVRDTGRYAIRLVLIGVTIFGAMPAATGEWTPVGPEGGAVLTLSLEPSNSAAIYAGTCTGVFKSPDGGVTWTAVNSGLPTPDCFAVMEIDPHNPATVYTASGHGVFKTTDGGRNWHAINSGNGMLFMPDGIGCPTACVHTVAVDRRNPAVLYAAASQIFNSDRSVSRGILKSTDAGDTWNPVNSGNFNGVAVDPNDGTVYASGYNSNAGLFKSSDGGATWTQIAAPRFPIAGLAIDSQLAHTLYYWTGSQIFRSGDAGTSWNEVSPPMPSAPADGYNHVQAFAVDPQNPMVLRAAVYQTSHGAVIPDFYVVFTSTDSGASWSAATDPTLTSSDMRSIAPDHHDPDTWYLGTSNGVLKTSDGGEHWRFQNSGLRAVPVVQVLISGQDGTLVALESYNPYSGGLPNPVFTRSTDEGKTWAQAGIGLPLLVSGIIPGSSDLRTLYALGQYYPYRPNGSGLFRSGDGGDTWRLFWARPQSQGGTPLDVNGPLAIDAADPNVMYTSASGLCSSNCVNYIFQSADGGRTWTASGASQEDGSPFAAIAINAQSPGILYGGTTSWGGWTDTALWRSLDQGSHWSKLAGVADSYTLFVASADANTIYLADGDIRKSTDAGENWSTILRGGYDLLIVDPQNSGTFYAESSRWFDGNSGGPRPVMRTTDAGATWSVAAPALISINSIAVDPRESNRLYAATGNGLFTISVRPPEPLKRR
jgi:photosystem II stability/assembly factor-like uncharacterized protein